MNRRWLFGKTHAAKKQSETEKARGEKSDVPLRRVKQATRERRSAKLLPCSAEIMTHLCICSRLPLCLCFPFLTHLSLKFFSPHFVSLYVALFFLFFFDWRPTSSLALAEKTTKMKPRLVQKFPRRLRLCGCCVNGWLRVCQLSHTALYFVFLLLFFPMQI